jgi:DNA-binding response OmpR family regulator
MTAAAEGKVPAEPAQMDRSHVFVINREPSILDLLRELLQEERYNVTTTNLMPRTFDQIAALQPSVLVVDLAFGQRAEWELLERLQEESVTQGIPVMVVSTDVRLLADVGAQRERYGGDLFLAKPFDIEEILAGIRSLVGEA